MESSVWKVAQSTFFHMGNKFLRGGPARQGRRGQGLSAEAIFNRRAFLYLKAHTCEVNGEASQKKVMITA